MTTARAISGDLGRYRAISGRNGLATKTKLERAVEEQLESLNDAQREIVLSQLSDYRRNRARISEIDARTDALNAAPCATREAVRMKQAERSGLSYERNQLAIANSRISADLFDLLDDGRRK